MNKTTSSRISSTDADINSAAWHFTFFSSSMCCRRSERSVSPSPSLPSIFSASSCEIARMRFSLLIFFASLSFACDEIG
jgi:hypothetical protein